MSSYINALLALSKWPLAFLSLCVLPATLSSWGDLWEIAVTQPMSHDGILLGFLAYTVTWLVLFRRRQMGSLFSTLEHELTHAIFAWLTFHPVVSLRATWSSGGSVRYRGEGNWLINLAPYWVPTLAVPLAVCYLVAQEPLPLWFDGLFGALIAYHMLSTVAEVHPGQTDLTTSGLVFSAMLLPTLNLMAYGALLTIGWGGGDALMQHAGVWSTTCGLHLHELTAWTLTEVSGLVD